MSRDAIPWDMVSFASPSNLIFSVKLGVVAAVSYYLGTRVSDWILPIMVEIGGLWSAISGILVLKMCHIESYRAGFDRLVGTLVGCAIGGLFLFLFPHLWLFPGAILVTALICLGFKHLENFYRPACIACSVVFITWQIGSVANVWLYSLARFVESGVGVGAALLIAHIPPFEKKK